jgi:DNA-binding HxlR family transcriptional regulator
LGVEVANEEIAPVGEDRGRYCPSFHQTVELLGRRWNGVILQALMAHAERFSEIRAVIPGLSDRLLAERLRELEREGLGAADHSAIIRHYEELAHTEVRRRHP